MQTGSGSQRNAAKKFAKNLILFYKTCTMILHRSIFHPYYIQQRNEKLSFAMHNAYHFDATKLCFLFCFRRKKN